MLKKAVKDLQFPDMPYAYDALEPYIDAQTMELHYTKHHRGYYDKFMNAVKGSEYENLEFAELLKRMSGAPAAVRNNGGGFLNHDLFWKVMSKDGGGKPQGELAEAIDKAFGSFDKFKEEFSNAAAGRFGSGWAWLIVDGSGNLKVTSTPNQDSPLMDVADQKGHPILGLDVWEHAYYLKYQNKRPDYIDAWWNVVNWNQVAEFFKNVNG
ncbi:MAG: superoxide dismutase [Bacteroidales bacterium]